MNLNEILDQLNALTAQVKDLIAEKEEVFEDDGFVETIKHLEENVFVLQAGARYDSNVDVLCRLTETGNGYIAYFPSYSPCIQDNYICMDYSEADNLRKLLTHIHNKK